jgi:quercetin dioxygenase-like cupin family protein
MSSESAWVLGHKIRRFATDDSYGLIEVTSPPKVPGPPPHLHQREHEFFLILQGELDVMADGIWRTATAGTFIELQPNTAHTFINNSAQDVVWVTGWRPKGFERFFRDFGIPADHAGARERSVSQELVQKVLEHCQRYGMYLAG